MQPAIAMTMNNREIAPNGNERIEALRKREADIRAKIAVERVKQQRKSLKEYERLKSIVGGALLANASQHPDFELLLKGILRDAALEDSEKKVLRSKGWL